MVKRWHILLMIGLTGVLSLLLAPFERLASGQDLSFTIRVVMLVQPAVLVIAAVATGQALAGKLGLGTPLIDAWLKGTGFGPVLRRQAPAALLTGLLVGLLMVAYSSVILPAFTDTATMEKMAAFEVPLVTRLLYGGITEELLTRWGLMALFAWALWRIVGKGQVQPVMLWTAIVIAAALFAVGHLPFLFAITVHPQPLLIVSVMLGNFIPGLMFGWLFWRRGLEAAMLSHAFAHCVNATVA